MKRVYEKFQRLKCKYPQKLNAYRYGELVKPGKFYLTTGGDVVFLLRNHAGSCCFGNGREIFEEPEIYNFEVEPRCTLGLLPTVQKTIRDPFSAHYAYTMALILEFGSVCEYCNIFEIVKNPDMLGPTKTIWQRLEINPDGKVTGFYSSENLEELQNHN